MKDTTTIRMKFDSIQFADAAYAFIQKMIKAIYVNGGGVLLCEEEHMLPAMRYRRLYMRYREKSKEYTEPIEEAERLLSSLIQDGTRIILEDCGALQGDFSFDNIEDVHGEFFVQLCFLMFVLPHEGNSLDKYYSVQCHIADGSFIRAVYMNRILRFDRYSGSMMNDRYEWEYREGYGGFPQFPAVSHFAAELKHIYTTDVPAFRDDQEINQKFYSVQEELGERGRILIRFPSAEPIIRVMIEADSEELCRRCMDEYLSLIKDKGYRIM